MAQETGYVRLRLVLPYARALPGGRAFWRQTAVFAHSNTKDVLKTGSGIFHAAAALIVAAVSVHGGLYRAESAEETPPTPPFLPIREDGGESDEPVTVENLMASVVAAFPRDPLELRGTFLVRRRRGVVVAEHEFAMAVHWGANPMTARYWILDEQEQPVEEMRLTRPYGKPPVWRYRAGVPLADRPLPDLYAPILDTDLSWADLSLSFLWWPGGAFAGEERIRGYACHIVEIPAPQREMEGMDSAEPYAKVRLWIEKKHAMLLQAEAYDAEGNPVRRLWVRSLRKIGERWMIKDLEVQRHRSPSRTKLTIREAVEPDPP